VVWVYRGEGEREMSRCGSMFVSLHFENVCRGGACFSRPRGDRFGMLLPRASWLPSHVQEAQKTLETISASARPPAYITDYDLLAMPDELYRGLYLTRGERAIIVALSYIIVGPLIYAGGKKLFSYIYNTTADARQEVRQERQQREGGGEAAPAPEQTAEAG